MLTRLLKTSQELNGLESPAKNVVVTKQAYFVSVWHSCYAYI